MARRTRKTARKLRGVQVLESRQLMAGDLEIDLDDGHLEIQGSDYRDVVEIRFDDSDNIEVEITSFDLDGDEVEDKFRQYDVDDVTSISLETFGGNDKVRIFHEDPSDTSDVSNQFSSFSIELGDHHDSLKNETEAPIQANGGDGVDTMEGGSGNDLLAGGDETDFLWGHGGNDTMLGEAGADWLRGGDGNDTMYGHNTNLTESNAAADTDRLYGQLGQDILRGGGGLDFLYGSNGYTDNFDTHRNYMYGDDGNDYMYGGSQTDYMYALNGNDYMYGRGGNDRMYGGNGTDFMLGEDGNDIMYGQNGLDYLYGGEGNDFLHGGLDGYNDRMTGDNGADTFVRYGYTNLLTGDWVFSEPESIQDFDSSENDSYMNYYGFIATPWLFATI